ncbi:MAG: hypothetical protein OXH52_10830 [Gammaproteobacteria bacterium]|nr:hypothetical protein [Gammaproteobacteria bacterium]
MKNDSPICGVRAGAAICGFLSCVATLTAVASYDSTSLDGNLQNQCTNFAAAVVADTSFTVAADCNKEGDTPRTVAASPNYAEFDLSGHVGWDTSNQTLIWDATLSGSMQDIAAKCTPESASPFTSSASDVTLALTCSVLVTDGVPKTASVSLPLNGNLQAGMDGNLSRR